MGPNHTNYTTVAKWQNKILFLVTLLFICMWAFPAIAEVSNVCIECHGNFAEVHGNVNHTATPPSGTVTLFADNAHDDAGWTGSKPYFAVTVDCSTCHELYLPQIHSNLCSTCHPSPYNTLGTWNGGCQQGGCHAVIHEDALTAHLPFENAYDPDNDCTRCHNPVSWDVVPSNCLNCHATPVTGYANPPVTTSNAQTSYDGTAQIDFSISQDGKVGIGRTFYKLDGGTETAGSKVSVSDSGSHTLEFWSISQAGLTESPTNTVYFDIVSDTTPPVTTSNAQASYINGALITLNATDDSTLGVKATYYSLNGGPTQTGTSISIPATSGTVTYTLLFWSEDFSGNVETQNSVTFTVTSGDVTLHLVWFDCDIYPANAPAAADSASWTVRRGGWYGPVVASGSATGAGWSGINDLIVPVSTTPYYVRIDWYWAEGDESDQTDFPNIDVSTPGQTIRLSY